MRFFKRIKIPSIPNFESATLMSTRTEGDETIYLYEVSLAPEERKRTYGYAFEGRSRSGSESERYDDDAMDVDVDAGDPAANAFGVFRFGSRAATAAAAAAAPVEAVVRPLVTIVPKGIVLEAEVNCDIRVVTNEFYNNARENLIRNLNAPLKEYVLRLIHTTVNPSSIPVSVKSATTFENLVTAWDSAFRSAPDSSECVITEEEIEAAMVGHTRPPCTGTFDIDAADFAGEVQRFNRTEILRLMCCLTAGGRGVIRFCGVSDRPSAVSMVWAVLRGVNDIDWMRRPKVTLRKE